MGVFLLHCGKRNPILAVENDGMVNLVIHSEYFC